MENLKHLVLVEEYISKTKSIEKFIEERLQHIYSSLKIYDNIDTKSKVISKIGYEIDEVLFKINTLESNRKSKFI